nr:MAG TPA: hypothetical protein [Caudoviricetes sp.]
MKKPLCLSERRTPCFSEIRIVRRLFLEMNK